MATSTESASPTRTSGDRQENALKRALGRFISAWEFPILRSPAGGAGLFATLILLCLVRAYTGLIGSRDFSHDAFMFFDGAWRMMCGQVPHRDFYTHLGFLAYVPTILGLWIARGTAWGFGYGQALVGLLLGVWTFLVCRKRLADVPAALMCLSVVLIAITPFAIGFSPMKISPAMTYNRQGYALLALILIEAFAEPREESSRAQFWGGFSSGAVLALAFFLKITYFAVGGFLILSLVPCRVQRKERWMGLLAGLLLPTLACCAYFRFHMGPMVRDLRMVGQGKHIHVSWYVLDQILEDAGILAAFALAGALLLLNYGQRQHARASLIVGIATAIAGTILILSNYEQNGFPLSVFVSLLVVNAAILGVKARRAAPDLFFSATLLLGSVLILGSLISGAIGMSVALAQRLMLRNQAAFGMPVASGFTTASDDEWYVLLVNNALPLIRKYRHPGDTIMSLDFTNPYSWGMGMRPAHGGTTVFQFGTTFNDYSKPTPEFLFGEADLVAVPLDPSDPTLALNVPRIYGPYLNSHFRLLGESRLWRLYRRNGE